MKCLCISIAAALLFHSGRQSGKSTESGFPRGVDVLPDLADGPQREMDAYLQWTSGSRRECHLPTALALKELPGADATATAAETPVQGTGVSVPSLLQALAERTSVTAKPFLWLHWGESDFMCLANRKTAHNIEKTDYHSKCVYDGLKTAFLGDRDTKDATIIQALGAFFLCNETHRNLNRGMQTFIRAMTDEYGHAPRGPFYDAFYLPVGDESSAVTKSWVTAAKAGGRPVVVVGPDHLASLHCMLNYVKHFRIPLPTHGCQDVEPLVRGIVELSQGPYRDKSVLFVVAGAAVGKMVAYEAFKKLKHKDVFVDVGASLDAYAGVRSRDYNKDLKRFCREAKGWMSTDVCTRDCADVHPERPCLACHEKLPSCAHVHPGEPCSPRLSPLH